MKRVFVFMMICLLLLTGCGKSDDVSSSATTSNEVID